MSTTDVDAPHPAGGTAAAASIAPAAAAFVSGPQPVCETFPAARAPVSPVLSWSSFFRRGGAPVPSILDAGQVRHVTSGRVAIAMALRAMQIGPGDKVLVPSYHCASMIEPVIWAGATPVFYKVKADTSTLSPGPMCMARRAMAMATRPLVTWRTWPASRIDGTGAPPRRKKEDQDRTGATGARAAGNVSQTGWGPDTKPAAAGASEAAAAVPPAGCGASTSVVLISLPW
jgi:hypothetical protein